MRTTGEVNTGEWKPLSVDLANFVAPGRSTRFDVLPPYTASLDVQHPVTQSVVKHTSEVDSAIGFSIRTGLLAGVVAFFAVLVTLVFDNELFSIISLLVFWGTFCLVFVVGWALDVLKAPEFGALYAAVRQWNVIEREQIERWSHYRWQAGRGLSARPWWVEYKPWIIAGAVVWTLLPIAVFVWGLT